MLHFSKLLRQTAWALFVAATAWFALALPTQAVDAQNRAMKAPDSVDALRLAQLAEVVPDDPVVLVAFAASGDLALPAAQRAELADLATIVRDTPGVRDVRIAPVPDPGMFLFAVTVTHDDELAATDRVLAALRPRTPPGVRMHAAGLPLVEGTIARLVADERARIVPLLLATLFAIAWAAYRSALLAAAALLPACAAIAWTSGILARLGHRLDPIAALLDPVLLTIGVATSVHLLGAFRRALAHGKDAAAAATAAAAELKTPSLLATATTMVGLWSLTTSDIPAVIDFGVRSALGIGLVHAFAFLLLPPLLARATVTPPTQGYADGHAPAAWRRLGRTRAGILAATAAVTALAMAGLARATTDNDVLKLLPVDETVRTDFDVLADRLGGVEAFHLLVPPRSPASEPSRLLPFVAALREQPGVAGLAGPVQRGPEGELAVPILLTPAGSSVRERLFADVERIAAALGFDDVVPAGAPVQIARDAGRLLRSLLGSVGLSLVLLAFGMAIGLRSWRLAALGIAPNLLPSLWLYGGLGWLGRPISVATAMIGCTMLGLVVDNTIHLLHRWRELRRERGRDDALRAAWLDCIGPMTLASVVLALGFGSAAASRLSTTAEFGVLAAATIATAWFGTAVALPAALWRREPEGAA